jgi:hypothetical protein
MELLGRDHTICGGFLSVRDLQLETPERRRFHAISCFFAAGYRVAVPP